MVLSVIVAGGALAAVLTPADRLRNIGGRVGSALESGLTLFSGISAAHSRAVEQFGTLAAPSPSDERILTELAGSAAVGRICLRELARVPASQLSPTQLHDQLARSYTIPGEAATIGRALPRWPCFRHVGDGQHQVGRALIIADVS